MPCYAQGERKSTDEVPEGQCRDEGGGDGQVCGDHAAGAARQRDDGRDGGQVVADHDGVRGLHCEVGPGAAHCDSSMRGGERGRVVDAVTHHGHLGAACLQGTDGIDLVGGEQLPVDVGDAQALADPVGGGLVVAGEERGCGAGDRAGGAHRRGCLRPELVGEGQHPDRVVVAGHDDRGVAALLNGIDRGEGRLVPAAGQCCRCADSDDVTVDPRGDTASGMGCELLGVWRPQTAVVGGADDGGGQRMLTGVLGGRGEPDHGGVVHRRGTGVDFDHFWCATSQRAGLVECDVGDSAELFHRDR